MGHLVLTTRIAATPEACFDLSLSVDAHTSSMAASGERAVAGVTTGMLGPGDVVTWRARHFGISLRMTAKITEYDRPRRFVDEQVSGPFASWWHEHSFLSAGDLTVMTDTVRYRAPAGLLGRGVEAIALDRYMARLLRMRNSWLKAALESESGSDPR